MGILYVKYTWSIGNCAAWCNIHAPSSCCSLVSFKPFKLRISLLFINFIEFNRLIFFFFLTQNFLSINNPSTYYSGFIVYCAYLPMLPSLVFLFNIYSLTQKFLPINRPNPSAYYSILYLFTNASLFNLVFFFFSPNR